jgi:hypothetical protein
MKLWNRQDTSTREPSELDKKAKLRIRKMANNRLLDTAEQLVAGMDRDIQDFKEHSTLESMFDLELGLVSLRVIAEELIARRQAELDRTT